MNVSTHRYQEFYKIRINLHGIPAKLTREQQITTKIKKKNLIQNRPLANQSSKYKHKQLWAGIMWAIVLCSVILYLDCIFIWGSQRKHSAHTTCHQLFSTIVVLFLICSSFSKEGRKNSLFLWGFIIAVITKACMSKRVT